MSYVPTAWSPSVLISARRLRHAEEQYDEAISYFNAHLHDDLYFTETEADAQFFHLSGPDTVPSGLDADTIDGQHAADLIGSALPTGAIMIWYDTDGNIPTGWAICNGGSGTPDLRDRFVVGAGNLYSVGNTGGVASVTPGAGTVDIATHAITIAEMPSHRHQYSDFYGFDHTWNIDWGSSQAARPDYSYRTTDTEIAGSDDPHGHSGSSVTITSEDIDNRPPYYALYYIQKVS